MKKITKSTLKSYINKKQLFYRVKSEFDGMFDGFSTKKNIGDLELLTIENLNNIWCHKNYIYKDDNNLPIELSNCCYRIELKVITC